MAFWFMSFFTLLRQEESTVSIMLQEGKVNDSMHVN